MIYYKYVNQTTQLIIQTNIIYYKYMNQTTQLIIHDNLITIRLKQIWFKPNKTINNGGTLDLLLGFYVMKLPESQTWRRITTCHNFDIPLALSTVPIQLST
jgi:hypothetical protein